MFRKLLQASSPEDHFTARAEERNDSPARPPEPGISERNRNDSFENAKLSSFEDIYHKSTFRASTSTAAWDIMKVAAMISSEHLHGLSPAGKHSALMMALEAAGVAVEDMLQDAVQRQRVLNEYEDKLSNKIQFLLDAILGFISIQQNDIFKVLTIVTVVGIPPMLVAGIYGMNFKYMPELDWVAGYPFGLALIVLSGVVPLAWFKWRGWF